MIDEKKKPSVDSFSGANKVKTPEQEEGPSAPPEAPEPVEQPINQISAVTLSKIAQSLSPDPTKLIQQQKAIAEQSKLVGSKRTSQAGDNSLEPERKKQKIRENDILVEDLCDHSHQHSHREDSMSHIKSNEIE